MKKEWKKSLKSLIRFHHANKIDSYMEAREWGWGVGGGRKKHKKKIKKKPQNMSKQKNKCFS